MNNWKPVAIDGYEQYEVNCLGHIHSNRRRKKPRAIKQFLGTAGYPQVRMYSDDGAKTFRVHTVVAVTHIGDERETMEVNHRDGDKTNNQVENLEWSTRQENMKHAGRMGVMSHRGETNPAAKLTRDDVVAIRSLLRNNVPVTEVAKRYAVTYQNIQRIKNMETWSHVS